MRTIEPLIKLDLALSSYCLRHQATSSLTNVSKAVSHTGDGHLYLILGLLAWGLDRNHGSQFFIIGMAAFAIELPIYWVVKNAVQRRRPQDYSPCFTASITPSDRYSLPSGHTAAAFLMATLIGQFYPSLYPAALIWAGLIGSSRIVLGVHFFTDVVAGALLGYGSAVIAMIILEGALL
ncbi:phosphatase PAP2 family protein [Vibrio metschnikovii]|uniref:phosphatase PAP2 family protein n=1 Tax=Vibrio metschnikovii TaxID=28172 RepID=UPI00164B211B|nr:phosphatase PAP2 family protein [Vibrio metschnikovii]MBC5830693.1 phosphatase PAP2 family protein [Vibrio metschnikovii]